MAIAQSLAPSSSTAARAARPKARRAALSRVVAGTGAATGESARRLVAAFDPAIPLASAMTPPSGWYTDPEFLRLELNRVFLCGWQAVGHIGQVKNPNDFFTGRR
ncbi:hypothetical protein ACQ4PT_058431 [Festuca glaucescens]